MDLEDNMLFISDNSSKGDIADLNKFLVDNEMGSVIDNVVNFGSTFSFNQWVKLFTETQEVSYECITWKRDWKYFKQHVYGSKIDALDLEPYIARYIKALSAIGIDTSMSCDGNHKNKDCNNEVYIKFHYRYNQIWHKIVTESILNLNIKWEQNFKEEKAYVKFNDKTQVETYLNLLKDANKIYINRIYLRELKLKTSKYAHQINKKIDRLSNEEVYNLLLESFYSIGFKKN